MKDEPDQAISSAAPTSVSGDRSGRRRPSNMVAQARDLLREGHANQAVTELDNAIRLDPTASEPWDIKARALVRLNRVDEAIAVLDTGLRYVDDKAAMVLAKGRLHVARGEHVEAIELFDRLTKIEPSNSDAWLELGWASLRSENIGRALECVDQVLTLDDHSAAAYALRGDSLLRLSRFDDAFKAFDNAVALDPDQFAPSSWVARAEWLSQNGHWEHASRAYEKATALHPRDPEAWFSRGEFLRPRPDYPPADYEGALAAFEQASSVDEGSSEGYLAAGELCFEHRDFDRALNYLERAKHARADDARPFISIGTIYEQTGQDLEARKAYEHALTIEPENASVLNALGNTLLRLNHVTDALRHYNRAIEHDPNFAWPYANRASVFGRQHRADEALKSIERAVSLDPDNATIFLLKLAILSLFNRISGDDIDSMAERALHMSGSDIPQRVAVAGFLAENQHYDRARDLLRDISPASLPASVKLETAECHMLVGEHTVAAALLDNIDQNDLDDSYRLVFQFLQLLLKGPGRSPETEELFLQVVRAIDLFEGNGLAIWSYKGVRSMLAASPWLTPDKLALTTLIDIQEAKLGLDSLSFFAERRGAAGS